MSPQNSDLCCWSDTVGIANASSEMSVSPTLKTDEQFLIRGYKPRLFLLKDYYYLVI